MNKRLLTRAIAATTLTLTTLCLAAPARALSFDLSRSSGRTAVPSILFPGENGLSLTVTADPTNRNVFQNKKGLGVTIDVKGDSDINEVDGNGVAETLILTFSERVKLSSAVFSRVQRNDQFQLFVDDNLVLNGTQNNFDISGRGHGRRVDFSSMIVGRKFGFFAQQANDDFLLSSVDVTSVPVPGAVLPGLVGLGTAVVRKKRTKEVS